MTNAFSLFRSLIIYGICLPLAVFIGYLLATPTDPTTYGSVGLLLSLMTIPLFLRWHYPWLVLSWNMSAGLYFLPGKPSFALVMVFASFSISLLNYVMNRNLKFISTPSVARPLIFIAIVVLGTAQLTGGIGLNILGSDAMGGKRYIWLLSAVVGFFALTAQSIPLRKANLYVTLFFLGAISAAIGNLVSIINPSFYFIFLIFPADISSVSATALDAGTGMNRLSGLAVASLSVISLLLARYGIQGLLNSRKQWRLLLFLFFAALSLFGGFRSMVIQLMLTCALLFYLEGLFRSRLLAPLILALILVGAIVIPFGNQLPLSVQRSLTFLPLNLDPDAEMNAKASTEWRLEMWANVLPTVPKYLILGKGLAIDSHDMQMWASGLNRGADTAAGATMAGDYHNGPLSLIIPFGLPGVAGFIWLLVAGFRVLYRNYQFGDPVYQRYNRFLLTYFIMRSIMFFAVFGSFYSDLVLFVGPIGLSIALNGGVRSPLLKPVARQVLNKFKVANAT